MSEADPMQTAVGQPAALAPTSEPVFADPRYALWTLWFAHLLLSIAAGLAFRDASRLETWFFVTAIAGQWVLLAAWAVLSTQPLLLRQCAAISTGLLNASIAGFASGNAPAPATYDLASYLVWAALFLGLQGPFWLARVARGWEIHRGTVSPRVEHSRQFSLRRLMMVVVVCSVIFAFGRFLVTSPFFAGLLLALIMAVVGGAIVASAGAALIAMVLIRRGRVAVRVAAGMYVVAIGVIVERFFPQAGIWAPALFTLAGFGGVVAGSLIIVRLCGYRLVVGRGQ